jgi:hypothetical protein
MHAEAEHSKKIGDELKIVKGAKFLCHDGTHVTSTGKIINYGYLEIGDEINLPYGDDNSNMEEDSANGTIHNHGWINFVLSEGKNVGITGNAKVRLYGTDVNAELNDRIENDFRITNSFEDYNDLVDKKGVDAIGNAAYYDLVNEDNEDICTEKFYKVNDATITVQSASNGPTPITKAEKVKLLGANFKEDPELPHTNGMADTQEAFDTHKHNSYFVERSGTEKIVELQVDNPTYFGGSIFSVKGYEEDETGIFKIKEKKYKVPEVDRSLVVRKTKPDTYTEDYDTGTEEDSDKGVSLKFTPWVADKSNIRTFYQGIGSNYWESRQQDKGDPIAIFGGDNSWYNGVFRLEHGGAVIDNKGAIFGGDIELGKLGKRKGVDDVQYDTAQALHDDLDSDDATKVDKAKRYCAAAEPVEFEWQGGAKDEYNRPTIYMNGNSTLYFLIPKTVGEDGVEKNGIFSFYGNIVGTPTDRIIIQDGEVLMKGDCSRFKGHVGIVSGAHFKITASDDGSSSQYTGKMLGGTQSVVNENGERDPNAVVEVSSDAGLNPLTFDGGTMVINQGSGGNDKLKVDHITINSTESDCQATVMVNAETDLSGTKIIGEKSTMVLNKGASFNFKDGFTLNKGTLVIGDDDMTEVNFSGDIVLGSRVNVLNNARDVLHINGNNIVKSDEEGLVQWAMDGSMQMDLDFWPNTQEMNSTYSKYQAADCIDSKDGVTIGLTHPFVLTTIRLFQTVDITKNSLADKSVINLTEDEYRFKIFQFTGDAAKFPPIAIPKDVVVVDKNKPLTDTPVKYLLNPKDAYAVTTETIDGVEIPVVTIGGAQYYIYGSDGYDGSMKTIITGGTVAKSRTFEPGTVTFVRKIDDRNLNQVFAQPDSLPSDVINDEIFDDVRSDHNSDSYINGGASFSTSTDSYGSKSAGYKIRTRDKVIRYDAKAQGILGYNTLFRGTMFASSSEGDTVGPGYRSTQTGQTMGYKGAITDRKIAIEAVASYGFINTSSRTQAIGHKTLIKSHAVTIASKIAYTVTLSGYARLVSALAMDYSFIYTPTAKTTAGAMKLSNLHKGDMIPAVNLVVDIHGWNAIVFAKYHHRFGGAAQSTINGKKILNADILKKDYVEYGVDVARKVNNFEVGFKLSRLTGTARNVKCSLSVGNRF